MRRGTMFAGDADKIATIIGYRCGTLMREKDLAGIEERARES